MAEIGELVLPATVSAEVDYLIRRRGGTLAARRFLEDLSTGRFRVECLNEDEHAMALNLHDQYAALDLGLADLSVLVLAHRFRTNRLLTFDEHDFRPVRSVDGSPFVLLPADLE